VVPGTIGEALKVVNKEAVQNASRNGSEPVQIGQNSTKGRTHTRGAGSRCPRLADGRPMLSLEDYELLLAEGIEP
jgi:hypothetical protein